MTKLRHDALVSEIESVRRLLERPASKDILGTRSLRNRLAALEEELLRRDGEPRGLAVVTLIFDGEPVRGASAIDAGFAAQALHDYQDLLSKQVVASRVGQLAQRGPLPLDLHRMARMNLTGLVHGSFGFVLEEDSGGQEVLFESATQRAVAEITDVISALASEDDRAWFDDRLPEMDARVFKSVQDFVKTLHRARSTLKICEDQREIKLDHSKVALAEDRVSRSNIEETEQEVNGMLLGIAPIQRRFDFRRSDTGDNISGRVAENISADYLERIDREGLLAGREWTATVRTKTVQRPGAQVPSTQHTLVSLTER